MKRIILSSLTIAVLMGSTALAQEVTISVAAFEGGYGRDMCVSACKFDPLIGVIGVQY